MQPQTQNPIKKVLKQTEQAMLELPQADCPVFHRFGPGIYIREVVMPAGTLAIGHRQKKEHVNILLKGSVAVFSDGGYEVLTAPLFFVGKPGRKIGYVLEDMVWQNIYATTETDIEKLEEMFLDKSGTFRTHEEAFRAKSFQDNEADRVDYNDVIDACPFSEDEVREHVENEVDLIEMPSEWASFITVRQSDIHGKGCFASFPIDEGACVGPARVDGMRTPLGRFMNHSKTPNCEPVMVGDDIYIAAKRDIDGCKGGTHGEELTVCYREMLRLSDIEV